MSNQPTYQRATELDPANLDDLKMTLDEYRTAAVANSMRNITRAGYNLTNNATSCITDREVRADVRSDLRLALLQLDRLDITETAEAVGDIG